MTIEPAVLAHLQGCTNRDDLDDVLAVNNLDGIHTAHAQADDPTAELNQLFLDADTILQWIQRLVEQDPYSGIIVPAPVEQVRLVRPDGTDA